MDDSCWYGPWTSETLIMQCLLSFSKIGPVKLQLQRCQYLSPSTTSVTVSSHIWSHWKACSRLIIIVVAIIIFISTQTTLVYSAACSLRRRAGLHGRGVRQQDQPRVTQKERLFASWIKRIIHAVQLGVCELLGRIILKQARGNIAVDEMDLYGKVRYLINKTQQWPEQSAL